jgi:hypothetical protein
MAKTNNPFPVLSSVNGNFNSFGAEFSIELSNVEFSDGKYKFKIKGIITNEPVLQELWDNGKIELVVRVESNPFFRKSYKPSKQKDLIEVEIDFKEVSSEFTFFVSSFLIVSEDFLYKNKNADFQMNGYQFKLLKNQKVAEMRKTKISFERAYKLFDTGPLIKINELKNGNTPKNGSMDINLSSYNIIVSFSKNNYSKLLKMQREDPKILAKSLGFPVIYHALSTIKDSLIGGSDEFRNFDWATALDAQFGIFEYLESSEDVLRKTDEVLNSPLIELYDHCISNQD